MWREKYLTQPDRHEICMWASSDFLHVIKTKRPLGILEHLRAVTQRWECQRTQHKATAISENNVFALETKHTWSEGWILCAMASSITGLPKHNAASVWWVQSPPPPQTHELWMAGHLTGHDTGESAWVEREQPWEPCLPATLETCQPPFQLKSYHVLYCTTQPDLKHRQ